MPVLRLVILMLLPPAACAAGTNAGTPPEKTQEPPAYVQCQQPRPQVCTQIYAPVCGLRDTGVRCIKAPCPSAAWRQYPNACMACSDKRVPGYRPGACPKTDRKIPAEPERRQKIRPPGQT